MIKGDKFKARCFFRIKMFNHVKAILPLGQVYDVKGIKMTDKEVEVRINRVKVHTHFKALPPVHEPANST